MSPTTLLMPLSPWPQSTAVSPFPGSPVPVPVQNPPKQLGSQEFLKNKIWGPGCPHHS